MKVHSRDTRSDPGNLPRLEPDYHVFVRVEGLAKPVKIRTRSRKVAQKILDDIERQINDELASIHVNDLVFSRTRIIMAYISTDLNESLGQIGEQD